MWSTLISISGHRAEMGGQDGGGYREAWKVSNTKMISKVPGVVVLNK